MPLPTRWRWKLDFYRRKIRERLEGAKWFAQSTTARQKVCPACRALLSAKESRCPFCNERLTPLNRVGVRRAFGGLAPRGPRYATMLLGVNFVLFAIALLASSRNGNGLQSVLSGFPPSILAALGARDYLHMLVGDYWRLITATFLHASFMHLAFNMWVLFDIGPAVEEMYGSARFLVLYLWAGVASSLVSFFWHPFSMMVGASGAIFGLIGVMIAYGYRHRTALGDQVKTMYVRWAIYGLIFGFLFPGIDNAAHIGGLIAGLIFGALFSDTPCFSPQSIFIWRLASYACLFAIAFSFVLVGLNYHRAF